MTYAFAVVLSRGVLVVADGRITNALNPADPPCRDDADKMEQVRPDLLAVIGGMEMASRAAAGSLRACDLRRPQQVIQLAAKGLAAGVEAMEAHHGEAFDRAASALTALVLAGIDAFAKPYVALVQHRKGTPVTVEGPRYDRLAMATFSADAVATRHVDKRLAGLTVSDPTDERQTATEIATCVASAIGELGDRSPSVGGLVRARYLSAKGITPLPL